MRKINIAIISRNTFLRASLMAIIHDLTRASDALTIEFSGEIHLCNTSIKNRKKNSSVIILHRYDELPEKTRIVNCLKDVTFVPVRTVNIDSLREIIGRALARSEEPESKRALDSTSICANCPHKSLSPSQVVVAHGLMNGFDIGKISALHQLSPKTVIYHKNQIMEKYGLNNHYDFFQFISVLKERG